MASFTIELPDTIAERVRISAERMINPSLSDWFKRAAIHILAEMEELEDEGYPYGTLHGHKPRSVS